MPEPKWIEFRPEWAKHVVGEYSERTADEQGIPEEQLYRAKCTTCGESYGPLKCSSGLVRQHIARFALLHLHRDPLAPIRKGGT